MIEYNTKRNKLIIREYGRNIQKLVEECVKIEDRAKRTRTAYAIVRIMSDIVNSKENSSDANRNNDDFWNKLWDHLYIMSDYQLDIDSPFPKPVPDTKERTFEKPSYNNKNRVDQPIVFNNTEAARHQVFRAYYYVIDSDGNVELTDPVYFYLYDIGNSVRNAG